MKLILVFCPSESAENVFTESFFDTCKHYALREFPDCLLGSPKNQEKGNILGTFCSKNVCFNCQKNAPKSVYKTLGHIVKFQTRNYSFCSVGAVVVCGCVRAGAVLGLRGRLTAGLRVVVFFPSAFVLRLRGARGLRAVVLTSFSSRTAGATSATAASDVTRLTSVIGASASTGDSVRATDAGLTAGLRRGALGFLTLVLCVEVGFSAT